MGLGGRDIEKGDAPARDAADREHRIEHAGRMIVGGISGGAGHLEHAVAAGERLADVRAVADMGGRLGERDLRHGATTPETAAKGEAGSAGMRSGVPAAASVKRAHDDRGARARS